MRTGKRIVIASLVSLAVGVTAQVSVAGAAASSCSDQTFEQPFLPWADVASYVLAPGGTFESGAPAWSISGGSVASGNEPYYVHGAGESRSLTLKAGGSATSQTMCATLLHPDLRFIARASGFLPLLSVEVLFQNLSGDVQSQVFAVVPGTSAWAPTLPLPFLVNLTAALNPDGTTPLAFRFTALSGSWQIDDVYVDPYKSG
jgi:hypothetical protein